MTTTQEVLSYLLAVREQLEDLPADERSALLEDVEAHLADLHDEGVPIADRLGSPVAYAAELRASSGLPARDEPGEAARRLADRVASTAVAQRAAAAWSRLSARSEYAAVRDFLPDLRPGWWVLRGYLAVAVLSWLDYDGGDSDIPIPQPGGSAIVGLLLVLLAVIASVRLGRGPRPRHGSVRLAMVGANVVLVVMALNMVSDHSRNRVSFIETRGPVGPLSYATNLYPYTLDGQPLEGVLLYDQHGMPVVLESDPSGQVERSMPSDAEGGAIGNAFPYALRVQDPSTGLTSLPLPRPPVRIPRRAPDPSATPDPSSSPTAGAAPSTTATPTASPTAMPSPTPTPTRT